MNAPADRQIVAKVKSVEGEVVAISSSGGRRILVAGDFIYSDEVVDTSKGKIFLVQDGDVVLQNDIAAILSQDALSPEEKAKIDKLLKEIENDEAVLAKSSSKDKLALASTEAGQEKHEAPVIVNHETEGNNEGVQSVPQVMIAFEPILATSPHLFDQFTPIPPPNSGASAGVVPPGPTVLQATTLDQLDVTQLSASNPIGNYYAAMVQNHNVVEQDIQSSFNILMHASPDAVLAVTVTGSMAAYNAAPLEFPAPIMIPFGLGVQPWAVIAGSTPDTITYLYRKADLNLLQAASDNGLKQDLVQFANDQIHDIQTVHSLIENQISGLSNLSLDRFEIQANLSQSLATFESIKSNLQLNISGLIAQEGAAQSSLAAWENTVTLFGIPLGSVSNSSAIASLEASWKAMGGTPETMPSLLESLYQTQATYQGAVDHLALEVSARQHLLNGLVSDIINPLTVLSNYVPTNDADLKHVLVNASDALAQQGIMAQSYLTALMKSLESFDLVLRSGLTNDTDFNYSVAVLLVNNISDANFNPIVLSQLFSQNGESVVVDALASGLKLDLSGHLSSDQALSVQSEFGLITTKLIFNLDLKFANPSADENIQIKIPGVAGLNWTPESLPAGWTLNSDNSLTYNLSSVPNATRADVAGTIILDIPTTLLKNVDLSHVNFQLLVNSQVVPVGDQEPSLNNDALSQTFNFNEIGQFPVKGIYLSENVGQSDALADPGKHAEINIQSLLQSISTYVHTLSGAALTNFLNNTKIDFKFFNVDSLEPPKVVQSDGAQLFVQQGSDWILTGQALLNYIHAWESASLADKAYYENPNIIPASYGADDIAVQVFGIINGSNQVVVQPVVPIIIDAVAQPIVEGPAQSFHSDVDLSNVHFDGTHAIFTLTVNMVAPDGDGSEARLIDINLTNVLQFDPTRMPPPGADPNWTVLSNNNVWHIEKIGSEVHLIGDLEGAVGNNQSTSLNLGFDASLLQYLNPVVNNNFQISIGGPSFNTNDPNTNTVSVVSQERLGPNEQDFNSTNDTSSAVYLPSGSTVEMPTATVILKEAQVDVAHLTPGKDAMAIDISKALDAFVANFGTDEFYYFAPPDSPSITVSVNGVVNSQFTLTDDVLYSRVLNYVNATTPADKAAAATLLYYIGQYNADTQQIEVDYNGGIFGNFSGVALPPTTVIFDAVGSGTDVPSLVGQGYTPGPNTSKLALGINFAVTAHDMTDETVVITIHLPHAPDASVLISGAPSGLSYGWTLDSSSSGSGSPWSISGDTVTGTFNLASLNTLNLASSLVLDFNASILQYLNSNVVGNNVFNATYSIHSIDSAFPNNYITLDNQSPDITGSFQVILAQNEGAIAYESVIGSLPSIYLGNLPEVPNANITLPDGAFDFDNAASAARMSTMLHVSIGFVDADPNVTRTVAIFLPVSGGNSAAAAEQMALDWQLLPGDENGWSVDTSYNSTTEIKIVKTFAAGSEALATGNVDDYVPISFLLTGIGSFEQRTLTANGPSPINPQEMGLHVQVTSTFTVDIGGGQTATQQSVSPMIATTQDITVPAFVMADPTINGVYVTTPTFTNGNDYYYISQPSAGLTKSISGFTTPQKPNPINETVNPVSLTTQQIDASLIQTYVSAIKAGGPVAVYGPLINAQVSAIGSLGGTTITLPADIDYSTLVLAVTLTGMSESLSFSYQDFSSGFNIITVSGQVTITSTYTAADAQADATLVNSVSGTHYDPILFSFKNQNNAIFDAMARLDPSLPSSLVNDSNFYESQQTPITLGPLEDSAVISYSYSTFSGSSVSDLGIGHVFNPGPGNDIVIGSDGRDIFNAGEQSFVMSGGTAVNTTNAITFGNEVFVGGLGRDWIESGAGNDVVYSDGTPLNNAIPAGIGDAYAPVFLASGLFDSSGHALGIFLPKVTDVVATGAGDDVIYTGGANYDSFIASFNGQALTVPTQFVGGVDDGVSDKTAGVLVFAGPGNNVVFSGKGADVIVLDDTVGLTRVIPTTDSSGHLTFTISPGNTTGLNYVYNSTETGGNFSDMFTGNALNTVQSLISGGHIFQLPGNTDPLAAYLYDVIRPIYDSSYDKTLTYNLSSSTEPLTATAINADHGDNTIVYWKDSVSTDPNSADIIMYFDITKDKINLTGLFNELLPNSTDAQRLAAIHVTPVTSVVPLDGTAEAASGLNVGTEGARISVTIGSTQYQVADLANVHATDVISHLNTIFDVHNAPALPQG